MSTPDAHKPDLSETSPMDTRARAESERIARDTRRQPASPSGAGPQKLGSGEPNAPVGGQGGASGGASGGGQGGGGGGWAGGASNPGGDDQSDPKSNKSGGTNIDTIIGKIVVDQGLATPEEVQACLEMARQSSTEGNSKSLPLLLVENDYITHRQLERLRLQAEQEKSRQQVPGYKVIAPLGAGAMATVYKAKQLSLDRLVAIKVLPKKFINNPQFVERFYAEGKAAAQLNHPNIVQAFDVGQAGDYHYFVMEYVEGRTVYDDIVKHKRYSEADAIIIIIQVAEALQHAHSKGLIHRDVKPKNIMISKEGVAKLADMGLARAMSDKEAAEAEAGKAFGTPYYISPEQIRGEVNIGPPSDIYSLGATLYHMVTGAVPFDGKNPSAVMHKHLKETPQPPDHVNPKLSAGVSEVIEKMMSKNPKERYANCNDLLIDLRAVRNKQTPPLAHKDIAALDLASVAKAEAAAAPAVLPIDKSSPQTPMAPRWMLVTVLVLLVISLVVNLVQVL